MLSAWKPLLLSVAFLLLVSNSWAKRVLLVEPTQSDASLFEAFGRIRGELELQHFQVVVLDRAGRRLSMRELQEQARSFGVFAAVALQRDAGGTTAEVCIVDRVTGKTVVRRLSIDESKDGPTLLAIRAVDLLRASLLELSEGEPPAADVLDVDPAPAPAEVVKFAHEMKRFQLRAGALVVADPTLGWAYGATLALRFRPIERLALELKLGGPVFGGDYQGNAGAARVRQEFALFRVAWNFLGYTRGRRWEWGPVLGVGLNHLRAAGNVEAPLVPVADDVFSLAAQGGLFAEFFINESVSFAAEGGALALVPQPVIAVTDERSSSVPVEGMMSLSLGVSF